MTLKQLAAASGVSVATLSKLENGQTGTSLESVLRIAAAFGTPVSTLLSEPEPASGALSVARANGPYSHGVRELDFRVLHDDLPGQHNVFWEVRVRAHSLEDFGAFHSHPGEEFFYVLSGRVRLAVDGREPIALRPGDSVHFDSALPHAYVSVGRTDALLLMSNTIARQAAGRAAPRARPVAAPRNGRGRSRT
jgi:transcriptional regulator with XRE-family HTH domain